MAIMKCADVFRVTFFALEWGWVGGRFSWDDLLMEEFFTREEDFHEGGISSSIL